MVSIKDDPYKAVVDDHAKKQAVDTHRIQTDPTQKL